MAFAFLSTLGIPGVIAHLVSFTTSGIPFLSIEGMYFKPYLVKDTSSPKSKA